MTSNKKWNDHLQSLSQQGELGLLRAMTLFDLASDTASLLCEDTKIANEIGFKETLKMLLEASVKLEGDMLMRDKQERS